GQSTTYLATDQDDNAVVVKESVLPRFLDQQTREKARELFAREAQLLSRCKHPRLARLLDHFSENERDYLVMQFIAGESLASLVRRSNPMDQITVLEHTRQITAILAYLHNQEPQIVHRDVTPDNLIIDSSNRLFLIDFGAANEAIGNATGTMIGKQSYIAP